MLRHAVENAVERGLKKTFFIHVDQGRDDSGPSALLRGGSQYAYTASPRASRIWAGLVA